MKILKHGDLKERRFKCKFCGCEFIADCSEYEYLYINGQKFVHVCCSDCNRYNKILVDNAPLKPEPCRVCTDLSCTWRGNIDCAHYDDLRKWKESNNESEITD